MVNDYLGSSTVKTVRTNCVIKTKEAAKNSSNFGDFGESIWFPVLKVFLG